LSIIATRGPRLDERERERIFADLGGGQYFGTELLG
jgi:hypothetical protein